MFLLIKIALMKGFSAPEKGLKSCFRKTKKMHIFLSDKLGFLVIILLKNPQVLLEICG